MANDSFALGFTALPAIERSFAASAAYVILLLLVFVGLTPFAPPETATAGAAQSAHGDVLRQVLYLLILVPIGLSALQRLGLRVVGAIPFTIIILLGWCLLSADWSSVPDVTFRRAVLTSIIVLSTLLSVETIGLERTFRLWRIILALILLVNWISIPLVRVAIHQPGELDPSLVGDWRGMYGQKNTAGAMCVLTALIFLFTRNGKHNWIGYAVTAAALGFLFMTKSKTSMGLFPISLGAGILYRLAWRDALGRTIFLFTAILLFSILAVAAVLDAAAIERVLTDPTEFTGRAEIWQASIAFLHDHFFLGAGFGTVANTGGISVLHNYVHSAWVEAIADSHNGYLQMAVTIGMVGFGIAMIGLVIQPLIYFWPLDQDARTFKGLLFALFVFVVLHNFTESDFLENDNGVWFAMLVVIASLRTLDKSLTTPGLRWRHDQPVFFGDHSRL